MHETLIYGCNLSNIIWFACRYIKELADRLNTLENSISTGDIHAYASGMSGDNEHSPGPSDSMSPPPVSGMSMKQGRKRTLSSSSDFHNALHLQPLGQQPLTPRPERLPSIDSFHPTNHPPPPRQLPPPPQHQPPPPPPPQHPGSASSEPNSTYRAHSSPNGMGYWKSRGGAGGAASAENNRRASVSFPFETDRPIGGPGGEFSQFDWNEQLVDQYVVSLPKLVFHPLS